MRHPYAICITCFLLFVLQSQLKAQQQKHRLEHVLVGKVTTPQQDLLRPREFGTQQECNLYLQQELLPQLQKKGYLAASVDSLASDKDLTRAYVFLGEQYRWGKIMIDSAIAAGDKQGARIPFPSSGATLDIGTLQLLKERILQLLEERGYPFASVQLDSSYFIGTELHGKFKVVNGPLYKIDSITVDGKIRVNPDFLERYLDVGGGRIYQKQLLEAVSGKLSALGFLKETQPWRLDLLGTGSVLRLYLEQQRSSRINLLAGLMPSNQQLGGRLLLTGEAELDLQNALGSGERIQMNWQQIQVQSPRLQLGFQKPYLFNTDAGIDLQFNLFKKDSSFLTLNTRIGVQYAPDTRRMAKVFFQQFSSNMIEVDTARIKFTRQLPAFIDIRTSNMGLEFQYAGTDYRFNPRKGLEALLRVTGGVRKVLRNNLITQLKSDADNKLFNFAALYDTAAGTSSQFRLNAQAAVYHPLGRQATFKTGIQTGWLFARQAMLNELFQVGGIKTLRGFDEESFFAKRYAIATMEYRYLVGQLSSLFAFVDIGYVGRTTGAVITKGFYAGSGLGLSFETKSGIFNLAYAVGKREGVPVNFRESKIHFGFVSLF